ncbi:MULTISPECIES: recombination protein NinG [unclassified Pseudomonas]|uniref:recombination protein NinG n=1 Tax=unclassified Pseudomonas TaxID=196821 RepID=UPI000BE25AB0|nr:MULTISPECIES: recombination protein NinG [unclassified Pseudomonas]
MKPRTPKLKACAHCGTQFQQARMGQKVCFAMACMLASAKLPENQARARKAIDQFERTELRAARERIKTKGDYTREAQAAFNAWVRLRDADQPCISCGRHHQGQYHAGHYRTTAAAPELRFEPLNVHKQCAPCNNHKSGDIVNYRIHLVKRIGADRVEWIEGPHEPRRYTIEELKAIKAHYRALARDLKGAA